MAFDITPSPAKTPHRCKLFLDKIPCCTCHKAMMVRSE